MLCFNMDNVCATVTVCDMSDKVKTLATKVVHFLFEEALQ